MAQIGDPEVTPKQSLEAAEGEFYELKPGDKIMRVEKSTALAMVKLLTNEERRCLWTVGRFAVAVCDIHRRAVVMRCSKDLGLFSFSDLGTPFLSRLGILAYKELLRLSREDGSYLR